VLNISKICVTLLYRTYSVHTCHLLYWILNVHCTVKYVPIFTYGKYSEVIFNIEKSDRLIAVTKIARFYHFRSQYRSNYNMQYMGPPPPSPPHPPTILRPLTGPPKWTISIFNQPVFTLGLCQHGMTLLQHLPDNVSLMSLSEEVAAWSFFDSSVLDPDSVEAKTFCQILCIMLCAINIYF